MKHRIGQSNKWIPTAQLLKYACVGLLSNAFGYGIYLLLTQLGATPKVTMTALYMVGAFIGFVGNRRLTFAHQGGVLGAGMRFVFVQLGGYAINFSLLVGFVDWLGYAHQWVQAAAVLIVACYLFMAFKFFVFKNDSHTHRRQGNRTHI